MHDNHLLPSERDTDALLDAALCSYADVSPRIGLDSRILARTAKSVPATRGLPGWRLLCAALVLLACILLSPGLKHGTKQEARNMTGTSRSAPLGTLPRPVPVLSRVALRSSTHKSHARPAIGTIGPFVSMPLSHQERLLLQLAAAPQHPLADLNRSAQIVISPIEITAIEIKPLPQPIER